MTREAPDGGGGARAAVFLDRDGTLIVDRHYLASPAGVELLPGAPAGIARLNRLGVPVVLVTNQSGIGRGYFDEADFLAVQRRMEELLAARGAHLDAVYHCPHAPGADPPCECRKPRPGLFLRAAREHGLDLAASYYVGDRLRDVEPGVELGGTGILVAPAGAGPEAAPERPPEGSQVVVAESFSDAVERVLRGLSPD